MEEYFFNAIGLSINVGYLETRASFYEDVLVTYFALLPVFIIISIFFAINKHLKLHQFLQFSLFFISIAFLGFFIYLTHYQQDFNILLESSSINNIQGFIFLWLQSIIALISIIGWGFTILHALSDRRRRALPGVYSASHKSSGKRAFVGIIFMSFSFIGIYWMLFIA